MHHRRPWLVLLAGVTLVTAGAANPHVASLALAEVEATLETPPLFDDDAGGNADGDDPAIWLHPTEPGDSLVVTTAKEGGLYVYDLGGAEVQHIPAPPPPGPDDAPGRLNNVDLLYGFSLGGQTVDLAIASDRGRDQLRSYSIDPTSSVPLADMTAADVPFVFSADQAEVNEQTSAYGLAVWRSDAEAFVFTSQRHRTGIAMVRLVDDGGAVSYERVVEVTLPGSFLLPNGDTWAPCEDPGEGPQVEGMVVDQGRGILYAAQEDIGIWRIRVSNAGLGTPQLIERVREYGVPATFDPVEEECVVDFGADPGFGGTHLSADAEGLTIYYGHGNQGYLLASSQGDSTFAVFDRGGHNAYLGGFSIVDGVATDGVQDSDGSAVLNVPLGAAFLQGLFVTHDGENTPDVLDSEDEVRTNSNFKFTAWPTIATSVGGGLLIDTGGWSPRD